MRIHFIAIGGSAMHNLAIALHLKGEQVSGSDDSIRDPSMSRLKRYGLLPKEQGWFPERITEDVDLIILGMHARLDNPELTKARDLGIRILSYPEYLYEHSRYKTRVVIAGSHGKTTITSMVLHALNKAGIDTDYMVGAQLAGFDNMVRLTDEAPYIVLEGDEYLSSPLDRRSKFLHYHPDVLLISGIAWDHINVFPHFEDYLETFRTLVRQLPGDGVLIYDKEDKQLVEIVNEAPASVSRIPYVLPVYEMKDGITYITENKIPIQIFGKHNYKNMQGASEVAAMMGVKKSAFFNFMRDFKGASRRLEILAKGSGVLIRDFAHAPSKVKGSVSAVKEQFPDKELLAVLELHTYSSLNKDFITHYKGSLNSAGKAVVYYDPEAMRLKRMPMLDEQSLKLAFGRDDLIIMNNPEALFTYLQNYKIKNTAVLMMSSGNFGGLDWEALTRRFR